MSQTLRGFRILGGMTFWLRAADCTQDEINKSGETKENVSRKLHGSELGVYLETWIKTTVIQQRWQRGRVKQDRALSDATTL